MADVTLSAAVRQSLLSLQSTSNLIESTQNRLSTGLKVAGPIDDPVAYFQAKSLDDRAFDFTEKKDAIDQGISIVTAALDGVTAVENLVRQLKGLASSLKSATGSQFTDLISQFNDIRDQINYLTTDSSYQGTNLINGTGESLQVEFSQLSQSRLNIASVDLTNASQGLSVGDLNSYTGDFIVSYATDTITSSTANTNRINDAYTTTASFALTWEGGTKTYTSGSTISFTYGTATYTATVGSGGDYTLNNGDTFTVNISTQAQTGIYVDVSTQHQNFAVSYVNDTGTIETGDALTLTWEGVTRTFTTADNGLTFSYGGTSTITLNVTTGASITLVNGCAFKANASDLATAIYQATAFNIQLASGATITTFATTGSGNNSGDAVFGVQGASITTAQVQYSNYVSEGDTTSINSVITELDASLATLRSQGSALGSNVALLKTRLDFTEQYVNTLGDGASKLTLADLNSEGANLLALQTRQSLGIQALSFAGQAEQGILRLFG